MSQDGIPRRLRPSLKCRTLCPGIDEERALSPRPPEFVHMQSYGARVARALETAPPLRRQMLMLPNAHRELDEFVRQYERGLRRAQEIALERAQNQRNAHHLFKQMDSFLRTLKPAVLANPVFDAPEPFDDESYSPYPHWLLSFFAQWQDQSVQWNDKETS